MIHTMGKEYHLSKDQIDTYYPEEVVTMLKFTAFDKKDESLRKQLDYYMEHLDLVQIQHGVPTDVRDNYRKKIEKLQHLTIKVVSTVDDDLPDRSRISALKESMRNLHKK